MGLTENGVYRTQKWQFESIWRGQMLINHLLWSTLGIPYFQTNKLILHHFISYQFIWMVRWPEQPASKNDGAPCRRWLGWRPFPSAEAAVFPSASGPFRCDAWSLPPGHGGHEVGRFESFSEISTVSTIGMIPLIINWSKLNILWSACSPVTSDRHSPLCHCSELRWCQTHWGRAPSSNPLRRCQMRASGLNHQLRTKGIFLVGGFNMF